MPLFLDAITTNETYFYRDHQHYQWLEQTFLPEMLQQAAQRKRARVLRIWSAACSTGEEPYSIALKVMAQKPQFSGWRIKLVGTDLSGSVLAAAAWLGPSVLLLSSVAVLLAYLPRLVSAVRFRQSLPNQIPRRFDFQIQIHCPPSAALQTAPLLSRC